MSGWISGAALLVSAVGTGASIYGSQQSAAASRAAGALNAKQQRAQAAATAAVQRFQADLNYRVAIAQAQSHDNNAIALKNNATMIREYAVLTQKEGIEQVSRQRISGDAQLSAVRAAYGASGVQSDTGSPLVVEAYNSGMLQLERMDTAYKTNIKSDEMYWNATQTDYQADLQRYQATLTRETAKQYQYAMAMANWTEKTGIIAANATQMAGNQMASAQSIAGVGNALSNTSSTLFNAAQMFQNLNNGGGGGGGGTYTGTTPGGAFNPNAQVRPATAVAARR
jgi:hypothetical protein